MGVSREEGRKLRETIAVDGDDFQMNETAHGRRKRRQLVVPDDQHLQGFELRNGIRKLLRMMHDGERPQSVHTCQGTTLRVPPNESETKEPSERDFPRDTGISNSRARRE